MPTPAAAKSLKSMEDALRQSGRGFGPGGAGLPPPAAKIVPPPLALRPGDIDLGEIETGGQFGLSLAKLISGRLLIQGTSGAGKSWTLRRLLEQTLGQIQQIVVDPEGEFKEFATRFDLLLLDASKLDASTLAIAAARAREHQVSLVLDMSELQPDEQMIALTAFFKPLVAAPREHWSPCLVAVDEAHLFAPFGGWSELPAVRKACIASMIDVMSRGRKRGLVGILATQRIARLHKSVLSDILNFLIGLNTLDLDIKRAAETIGWESRKASDRLPALMPGEFIAVGPAFIRSPTGVKIGDVQSVHLGATPQIHAPEKIDVGTAAKRLNLDDLLAITAADQEDADRRAKAPAHRAIRQFIRDPAFADAGRVFSALVKIAPDGARLKDLAKNLNRKLEQIVAALALLDEFGVVEFDDDGPDRAARVQTEMLP